MGRAKLERILFLTITMEYYYGTLLALFTISILTLYFHKSSPKSKTPPGPKQWPIIGNIHLLGTKPHRSVAELAKKYGPLMTLKLGSITTIVISSSEVAKEMFLKHDLAFSSRCVPDSVCVVGHEKLSVVWLPVGPKWRELRKILSVQLFHAHQLDASQGLRMKKVHELLAFAKGRCEKGLAIDIAKAVMTTSFNLLSNTLFSMDFSTYDSSLSEEFRDLTSGLLEEAARPNVSDFFPLLRPLDLQWVNRKQTVSIKKMLAFFEKIIDERLKDQAAKEDVLSTLLKLVETDELTLADIKHLLVDIFIAGTDTTASTLEWAMTELLCQPELMTKAQAEIDRLLGDGKQRSIQESDISELPYIQAIVKEILRVHPPVPLLIPHMTEKDVQVCGYSVPKHAQVWVNVWMMGRDPSVWTNPESFDPDRFLTSDIDTKGHDFELIPFGTGRRICPGMSLAHRMLHLILATLLHSFNWKLEDGLKPEEVDMEEKFGIALKKVHPLHVIPFPR